MRRTPKSITMKKILTLILAALLFAACGSSKLIGTWEGNYFSVDHDKNPIDLKTAKNYKKQSSSGTKFNLTFNKENECGMIETLGGRKVVHTYRADRKYIYLVEKCTDESNVNILSPWAKKIPYTIKDNQLIMGYVVENDGGLTFYVYYTRKEETPKSE